MTVIDPSLDAGPGASGGKLPEGRDVAMLRHDIRGALQGVIGGIGQIDAAGLDARTREQVDRVAAAAQTLRALVCAVLGDEPGPDETRPVDVAGFLRYVRRRHGGEASERGLVLEAAAEPGVPDGLRLDLIPLARIADNLIGNAIKFSEAGTVRLSVAQDPDGALIVRVADDGPGLAAAPAAGESDRSGEGLGLKIVRSLAAGLGGEVQLANRPSGGAEATVRIPAGSVAAAARGDVVRARPRGPPCPARRGQSDQSDGRDPDAARAQCPGDRVRRRRRGAGALRERAGSTWSSSTSRCRGCPAST